MLDDVSIDQVRADANYDLVELYDYNTANEDMNDSPFRYSDSTCEYYETEEFSDILMIIHRIFT